LVLTWFKRFEIWLMAKRRNSEGFLQYERDADAIGERIKRGEITTEQAILDELLTAIERNVPDMSKKELFAIQARILGIHTAMAGELAARGRPVPGNDPSRPN
jgi:hypothetical protein